MTRVKRWFSDGYGLTDLGFFCLIGFAIVVLVSIIMVGVYFGERYACNQKLDALEREGRYGLWTGCLVRQADGSYVPLELIRKFGEDAP